MPLTAYAEDGDGDHSFEFTFTPGVWLTRLNGSASLGNSPAAADISFEDSFDLDDLETAFSGELSLLIDDQYQVEVRGLHFSTDSSGVFEGDTQFGDLAISDGDAFDASLELTTVAAEFSVWLWQPYCIGKTADGRDCHLSLRAAPLVGVRYFHVDQSLEVSGIGNQSAEGDWIAPYAGLQMQLYEDLPVSFPILDGFEIGAGGGVGLVVNEDIGTFIDLRVGMTAYFCPSFGLGVGYRLLHLDAEDDDYAFDGTLQGLFFFGKVRF